MNLDEVFTLHDDVGDKLKVMSKWDAMLDDARNPTLDFEEQVERFLEVGKTYRVRILIEKIDP